MNYLIRASPELLYTKMYCHSERSEESPHFVALLWSTPLRDCSNGTWISGMDEDSGIEAEIRSLSWANGRGNRVLVFNCNVPSVGKNVDMCLLSMEPELCDEAVKSIDSYIALGELKGGIDPAGADEHWKTATTALDRIRIGFNSAKSKPAIFFMGLS